MAISEDTAALVAAQLTQAWAIRMGVWTPNPRSPLQSDIALVYEQFRSAVREKEIKHPTPPET